MFSAVLPRRTTLNRLTQRYCEQSLKSRDIAGECIYWIKLEGDTIYVFTDGYQDQFGGPRGKKFKTKQLKQHLIDHQEKSMDAQHTTQLNKFREWKGEQEQVDDVCIIGVRI